MAGKTFKTGALLLMFSAFFVKILGFIYRVYLTNLIGAEGMGLFQLISPLYTLIILTLTSGISIAVSKTVAEQFAHKNNANLKRIAKVGFSLVVTASFFISIILILNIRYIADIILKDSRTYFSLLLLVPCIPVISASGAIKGYFYGMQYVLPTAVSQIVEQVIRISFVMIMAQKLSGLGLEYACALATSGMLLGEIANLAVLLIVYKTKKIDIKTKKTILLSKIEIFKKLMNISAPISLNRFITSLMSAVEVILIPRSLVKGGLEHTAAIEEFGKLTAMSMPLVFFPSMVTSSIAIMLVPAISESVSLKNNKTTCYRISKSIQLAFMMGFLFTAFFYSFSHEVGDLVYKGQNIGGILYLLGYTCVFIYLHQMMLGILNGLGKQTISLRNSVFGYIIRIGFVFFLVPQKGISAYIIGILISFFIVCLLDMNTVVKTTGMKAEYKNWIIIPGTIGLFLGFSGKYIKEFFIAINDGTLGVILAIGCFIILAGLLMSSFGDFGLKQLKNMVGIKIKRKTKK